MNTNSSKKSLQQRVDDLVAGTSKHPPTGSLTLGNASYTAQSLAQVLKGLSDAIAAADAARASWQQALGKMAEARTSVIPVVRDYLGWVKVTYRSAPSTLADFGVAPPKVRTPLTVEQQAAAVAKREATRTARHTMGPVQKKKVKGTVAPAPAPATPTTAPQPVAASPASPAASVPIQGTGGAAAPHTS
ncbi:MAG: hypothetical protein ACRENE_13220 [Polyangiaceae bacterium]